MQWSSDGESSYQPPSKVGIATRTPPSGFLPVYMSQRFDLRGGTCFGLSFGSSQSSGFWTVVNQKYSNVHHIGPGGTGLHQPIQTLKEMIGIIVVQEQARIEPEFLRTRQC